MLNSSFEKYVARLADLIKEEGGDCSAFAVRTIENTIREIEREIRGYNK